MIYPQLIKVPRNTTELVSRVDWFARLARKQDKSLSKHESIMIAQIEVQRQLDILESQVISVNEIMPWLRQSTSLTVDLDDLSEDAFQQFLESSCEVLLRVF